MFSLSFLSARGVAGLLLAASLLVGAADFAMAATFATFDPSNGSGTSPYDVNSQGVISGSYVGGGAEVSAFLRAPSGSITTYIVPGAKLTYGFSINAGGTVAGSYRFSDNKDHGFIRAPDGTITTFDVAGADETTPVAINVHGAVTGYANGETSGIGFLRTPDGTITTFVVPGKGTYPISINAEGKITGWYCCVFRKSLAVSKGFVRQLDGSFTTFLPPDTRSTHPTRILASGTIAGFAIDFDDNYHGFIRANGQIKTFDVPGGSQTEPTAMNLDGIIAGDYYDGSNDRGFLFNVPTGKFIRFDAPNARATFPVAISDKFVTGYYYPSSGGNYKGFVRLPGK